MSRKPSGAPIAAHAAATNSSSPVGVTRSLGPEANASQPPSPDGRTVNVMLSAPRPGVFELPREGAPVERIVVGMLVAHADQLGFDDHHRHII